MSVCGLYQIKKHWRGVLTCDAGGLAILKINLLWPNKVSEFEKIERMDTFTHTKNAQLKENV